MKFIPVNIPLVDGNEKKYLEECIDTGWISSEGPFVKKFETKFAKTVDREYAVAVNNGTSAIDAVVEALGISRGDEIIMPSFTIISCVAQIIRSGAKPILVDSDPETWNMDINQVEDKITAKTKAIMAVHIYGLPVDLDPILDLAEKYGLKVIEDAAEMIGQTYKGKPCGSFGDISTFSFYSNKHITTGEGGMIVTNNKELAEDCKSLRNLCFTAENRFVHNRLGWNLRMTNLQAAVGLAQLERLDEFIKKKRSMGALYSKLLNGAIDAQLPLPKTSYAENIFWVYGIVLGESIKKDAKLIINDLGKNGVGCRPFFYPLHKQPVLRQKGLFKGQTLPVSEQLYKKGFYIPSGLAITNQEIEQVVECLIRLIK